MSCPYHANTTLVAQVSLEEVSQGGKIGPFTYVWTRLLTVSPHLREAWRATACGVAKNWTRLSESCMDVRVGL